MAYIASVVDKSLSNGTLTVTISYQDGVKTVTETVNVRSGQTADWLQNVAIRRVAELEALDAYEASIALGVIDTTPITPPAETPREEYERKLKLFRAALAALRMGILTENHDAFVNLRTWLVNNFQADYVDLFVR